MLSDYGIELHHTLCEEIELHLVLPGPENLVRGYKLLQKTPNVLRYSPEATMFLKKSATLIILSKLLIGLKQFLAPVLKKEGVFVYFALRDCEVFSKYLKCQVAQIPLDGSEVKVIVQSDGNGCPDLNPDNAIIQVKMHLYHTVVMHTHAQQLQN